MNIKKALESAGQSLRDRILLTKMTDLISAMQAERLPDSPVNSREYSVPSGNQDWGALTAGDLSVYQDRHKNNPGLQKHERIHVGQNRLNMNELPEWAKKQIQNMYPGYPYKGNELKEIPAYAITQGEVDRSYGKEDTQEKRRQIQIMNYLNLLRYFGGDQNAITQIESQIPEYMQEKIFKKFAPLPRPPKLPGL